MLNRSKILIFFLFVCLGQEAWSHATKLTNFRFSVYPDKIRLVFDVTSVVNYTATAFPDKIIVDIKKTTITTRLKKAGISQTPVTSISSTQNGNGLYLTINLKNPVKLRHFFLTKPDRLILDLYPAEKKEPKVVLQSLKSPSSADQDAFLDDREQDLINKMYKASDGDNSWRHIIVVIDPGHGGRDSGAVGYNGTLEKDVTLAVARVLQKIINNTKGFRAVLTRDGDYFIPLRRRLGIAHNRKADMFISIHADAYMNRDAHGASVFALSQRGATSEAARWLAEKENESELGQAISDKNALLRSVLIDLAQTATTSASLEIGGRILQKLADFTSLHAREVEQAAFVVLKSPDIPSLLVEVGFISHSAEEQKLRNVRYREEIATKLASGIQTYFMRRPPPGTYLAKTKPQDGFRSATLGDALPGTD